MKIDWQNDFSYLYGNRLAIESGAFLLITAAIKTLPLPGQKFTVYEWFYDWSHQFLNLANERKAVPSPAGTITEKSPGPDKTATPTDLPPVK